MLSPIRLPGQEVSEGTRICECCKKEVKSSSAINIMIVVGSPGHADMLHFQCPNEEQWACSLECWTNVANACIEEHILEILKELHKQKGLL